MNSPATDLNPVAPRRRSRLKKMLILSALLLAVALGAFLLTWVKASRVARAKLSMSLIVTALERYHVDFRAYPPDTFAVNGSEVLYEFLCKPMQSGDKLYGPYLVQSREEDTDGNGHKELITEWGRDYIYVLDSRGMPLVIDRGPDNQLGGSVYPDKIFTLDNLDRNADGVPDFRDDIYGKPSP